MGGTGSGFGGTKKSSGATEECDDGDDVTMVWVASIFTTHR